jgi:hypothetical protein
MKKNELALPPKKEVIQVEVRRKKVVVIWDFGIRRRRKTGIIFDVKA